MLRCLGQESGFCKTNLTPLLRFQYHFKCLFPLERVATLGKLPNSAVMEGFSLPKSFKCFFRGFSTRRNLILVMPGKWSKLKKKILKIGMRYDSKSQIAISACCPCRGSCAFESPCFALDVLQLYRFEIISLGPPAATYIKTHTDGGRTHTERGWAGLKYTTRETEEITGAVRVCVCIWTDGYNPELLILYAGS